ncbi:MAG: 4Fe-4S binding protein [Christensenellales bacterium]
MKFPKISEKAQINLQKFKYVVLLFIVLLCFSENGEYVAKYSPWTVFSLITQRNFKIGTYIAGSVLLVFIIIGMMLKERFFCQFICPLGAVFSLLPKNFLFSVKKKEEKCFNGCKACTNKCPVHLKYDEAGMREGECISCGRCFMVCPHRMKKK